MLNGTVTDDTRVIEVGDLVGEWWAISGFPVSHNVVGGVAGGTIGCISLDRIAEVGQQDANLAIKMVKLIGIGATYCGQVILNQLMKK